MSKAASPFCILLHTPLACGAVAADPSCEGLLFVALLLPTIPDLLRMGRM